jgi:ABC-type branched-subunit amino acid transport system ATPase component
MLKLENLHVKIGKTAILHEISLQVKPGEIVGIIGPNGSGKTTLLNAISGFARVSDGSVIFKDRDITRFQPYRRANLGVGRSFQNAGVFRDMTVEENLMIAIEQVKKYPWWWKFSDKYCRKTEAIIDKALDSVGLAGHKKSLAGVLSGGQLRLLELLRLGVSDGDLLLIDEPTAGVAPAMKKTLSKTIRELLQREGGRRSILIIEHDLKFLFELVDRVIVIVDGNVYMEGKPEEVSHDQKLQEVYFG